MLKEILLPLCLFSSAFVDTSPFLPPKFETLRLYVFIERLMLLGTAVIEAFQSFGVDCKLACVEVNLSFEDFSL